MTYPVVLTEREYFQRNPNVAGGEFIFLHRWMKVASRHEMQLIQHLLSIVRPFVPEWAILQVGREI